jgi:ferredoxin
VEAPAGTSICEALLDNGIKIEHACDMSCACTTCHVIVRAGGASLNEAEEKRKTCWTAPGAWSRNRACPARPSWRSRT